MCTGMRIVRRLVGDRARDGLADPPRRVRRELVAAAVVELLDRPDQSQRALLDQVQEGQAASHVALGDRDDEAQVGLDHVLLGEHVAALDALGERDLFGGAQQRHAADRAQVEPQRVQAGSTVGVDSTRLRSSKRARSSWTPRAPPRRPPPPRVLAELLRGLQPWSGIGCESAAGSATSRASGGVGRLADDLDPVLLQVAEQVLDLLGGDLRLLQRRREIRGGHESAFLTVGDQRVQLLHVDDRDGRLDGADAGALQRNFDFIAQLGPPGSMRLPRRSDCRPDLPNRCYCPTPPIRDSSTLHRLSAAFRSWALSSPNTPRTSALRARPKQCAE